MDKKKQKRGVCLDYGFKALPSLRVGAQGHENGPSTQGDGVSQEGERKGKTWARKPVRRCGTEHPYVVHGKSVQPSLPVLLRGLLQTWGDCSHYLSRCMFDWH